MAEETVNREITTPSDEPERLIVDASLMQVLNSISASLKRLEEHLVPKDEEAKVPSPLFSKILGHRIEQTVCGW
jgi:hypothetical protein